MDDEGKDDQWVSARKAIAYFRFRARLKGLLLYATYFFAHYVHYQLESDWLFAGNTIFLYRKARNYQEGVYAGADPWCSRSTGHSAHSHLPCWWHFKDSENKEHLHEYLADRISTFASGVQKVCPNCRVGITTTGISLESLSHADMACADFDSKLNSNVYSPIDCVQADSTWEANPSARGAPCCGNKTLVKASMTMMARQKFQGEDSAPLASLLRDTGIWYTFIDNRLDSGDALVQVVISRGQRMVGIIYSASALPQEWSPGSVKAYKTYWSRRYDIPDTLSALEALFWIFCLLSLFHTVAEAWATCTDRQSSVAWALRPNTVLVFLTCLPPIAVRVADPLLAVNSWTLLVAVCEICMLARLVFEAEVIPACRVLLRAMAIATPQLATLLFVLAAMILIVAGVSGQLFGPFMYTSYSESFFDVLSQFATGAVLNDQAESYNAVGSKLIYFVVLFALFLTLSQVFITILMDAFEAAREDRNERQLELALPEGYVAVPRPERGPIFRSISVTAFGWAFYYLPDYGAASPQVMRALFIAMREAEAEDPSLVGKPLLLRKEQIVRALASVRAGPKAAGRLHAVFGAELDRSPPAVASPKHAAVAVDKEAARRDALAELRAAVLERSVARGVPIPYDELQRLSEETLQRLKSTLTAGPEPSKIPPPSNDTKGVSAI